MKPSFGEGFGLPVLCSDIPPSVEIGRGAPAFFEPLDGPPWHIALIDYAAPNSWRRAAQVYARKIGRRLIGEHVLQKSNVC